MEMATRGLRILDGARSGIVGAWQGAWQGQERSGWQEAARIFTVQ